MDTGSVSIFVSHDVGASSDVKDPLDFGASSYGMAVSASPSRIEAVSANEEPSRSTGRRWRSDDDTEEHAAVRGLSSREIISHWNLVRVARDLGSRSQCMAFAKTYSLVAAEKLCRTHRVPMKIAKCRNQTFGYWVCHKGKCKQKSKTSRALGTFFENVRIDIRVVFYLIYAYARHWSYEQTVHESPFKEEFQTCLSHSTVASWFDYLRDVIVSYYLEQQQQSGKIGGVGKIVQIDESKFGERKYNRGRRFEDHWVLGMIEEGSKDLRLEVCPDEDIRNADVLVPLIQKHVEEGTIIHTDHWKAYNCLSEHGYTHKKVNQLDPDNPVVTQDGTHTQKTESQWKVVKKFFKREHYNDQKDFAHYVIEYLWRRHVYKHKKDPFLDLMEGIKFVYRID